MSNFVGTPQLFFSIFFLFISYVFVNIADMQIIKKNIIQFGQHTISRHQFGTKLGNLGLLSTEI